MDQDYLKNTKGANYLRSRNNKDLNSIMSIVYHELR